MEREQMTLPPDWKHRRPESWTPAGMDRGSTPTDAALCLAIAYSRLSEATFDEEPALPDCTGFKEFQDYILGYCDGIPKTPHWAARRTGIPSYTIKALARHCGAQADHADARAFGTEKEMAEVIAKAEALDTNSLASPWAGHRGLPRTLIGGTVYDYEADEVIEGALVTIKPEPGDGARDPEGITNIGLSVTTDDFGNFLIDGAERGTYQVAIEKEGYSPRQWGPIEIQNDANLRDFPMFSAPESVIWW